MAFLSNGSNFQLFKGLRDYLLHKKYNQDFGDIVPIIISNAFDIELGILNVSDEDCIQEISVAPRSNQSEYLVHRHRYHFNGITFNKEQQQVLQYSADFLKSLHSNAAHLKRSTRKSLFKHKMWKLKISTNQYLRKLCPV